MATNITGEVLVVDARAPDWETLVADASSRARVRVVGPDDDPVRVIDAALAEGAVSALHLVGHGAPGRLFMGRGAIDVNALIERHVLTSVWSEALAGADILIYGCEVGHGAEGARFLDTLSALTGARAVASSGLVGATEEGPNWRLDVESAGPARAGVLFSEELRESYRGTLANVAFSMTPDYVTEVPASKVTFKFELDQAPAAGKYYSVWMYATPTQGAPITQALPGGGTVGDFDLFGSMMDPAFSNDGIQILTYKNDVSVEAGVSDKMDWHVLEVRLTQKISSFTMTAFDDGSSNEVLGGTNPRHYYWNVIDDPINTGTDAFGTEIHTVMTVTNPSIRFNEYRDASQIPTNAAPNATNDSATTAFGTPVQINVLANDSDADGDTLGLSNVGGASHGTTSIANGRVVYTPNAGFSGTDSFSYTVSDGKGGTDTATVNVTVQAKPNTAPNAANDAATTAYGAAVAIDVLSNDADGDGDALTLSSVGEAANGTTSIVDGRVVYTPNAGFSGSDSFSYTVSDGNGGTDVATVNVTVQEQPNAAPTASNDSATVVPGGSVAIDVLSNDADEDGDALTLSSVGEAANGTTAIVDGRVVYTPNAGFSGSDSFSYTVSDGNGGTDTATVDVKVARPVVSMSADKTVLAEDDLDALTLTFNVQNLPEEGVRVSLGAYRSEGDSGLDLFKFAIAEFALLPYPLPDGSGVLFPVLDGVSAPIGWDDSTGLTFTITKETATIRMPLWPDPEDLRPGDPNYFRNSDTGVDTLVWRLVDFVNSPYGAPVDEYDVASGRGQVTLKLKDNVSQAYEAADDVASTNGRSVEIDVLANDGDGVELVSVEDSMTSLQGLMENGVAVIDDKGTEDASDDTIVYTPNEGFVGRDYFSYLVRNADGELDQARVAVDVSAFTNTAPVASGDVVSTAFGSAVAIDVLSNDADEDGDALTLSNVGEAANGTTEIVDGRVVYTPNAGFSGTDSFSYTVSDGKGGTDTATVNVTVQAKPNTAPNAANDAATTAYGAAVAIDVLSNDADADEDMLTLSSVGEAANGTTSIVDGRVVYTPNAGFSGSDSFSYTVSDGNGGTDTATVNVTVQEQPNAAPTASNDSATVVPGGTVAIDVLSNDADEDGDALTLSSVGEAANGTTEVVDGRVVYTPNAGFSGTDSFSYTVSDGNGGTDTATVDVNVARPVVGFTVDKTELAENDLDALTLTFNVENLPEEGVRVSLGAYRGEDSGQDTFKYGITQFVFFPEEVPDVGWLFPVMDGIDDPIGWEENDGLTFTITKETATVTLPLWPDLQDTLPGDDGFWRNNDVGVDTLTWRLVDFVRAVGTDVDDYEIADGQGFASVKLKDDASDSYEAGDDAAETTSGRSVEIDVMANDGDAVEIVGVEDRANADFGVLKHGTVTIDDKGTEDTSDDTLIYIADEDFVGRDSFIYAVRNADGELDTARVTVDVGESVFEPVRLEGTSGLDRLFGTSEDEIIAGKGGAIDILRGGGGADVFEFGDETYNGVAETDYILDFGEDDRLELNGVLVDRQIQVGDSTHLILEGDGDRIVLNGVLLEYDDGGMPFV